MDQIQVRAMIEADLDFVIKIQNECFVDSYRWHRGLFESQLLSPHTHVFVAVEGQVAAGFVGAWIVKTEAHLFFLATHPGHRRRGIGSLLLAHLLEFAQRRGVREISVEVASTSGAKSLYRKKGFSLFGLRRDSPESILTLTLPPTPPAQSPGDSATRPVVDSKLTTEGRDFMKKHLTPLFLNRLDQAQAEGNASRAGEIKAALRSL
jgi:ribosomal-protein-alanine N-acetyltransferase